MFGLQGFVLLGNINHAEKQTVPLCVCVCVCVCVRACAHSCETVIVLKVYVFCVLYVHTCVYV